jgi:hypothetical protein
MAGVLIDNINQGTSDEDIRQFLTAYGMPPCDAIEHVPGDTSRPSVLLRYANLPVASLRAMRDRLDGMFWKNRRLTVVVLDLHDDVP